MSRRHLLAFVAVLFVWAPNLGLARRCPRANIFAEYEASTAVFHGRVVAAEARRITFEVVERWKGVGVGQQVVVQWPEALSRANGRDCAPQLPTVGAERIVFARIGAGASGVYSIDRFSWTGLPRRFLTRRLSRAVERFPEQPARPASE